MFSEILFDKTRKMVYFCSGIMTKDTEINERGE